MPLVHRVEGAEVGADRMMHEAAASEEVAGRVARVRERLCRRAWVFDDPRAYIAGVEEALQAVAEPTSLADRPPVGASSTAPPLRSHTA